MQCAAVRTQLALIRVPPQNWALKTSEPALEVSATCQGASPRAAFVPPTILVKLPLLSKSSLLRDPEQEVHVPPRAVPQGSLDTDGGGGVQQA